MSDDPKARPFNRDLAYRIYAEWLSSQTFVPVGERRAQIARDAIEAAQAFSEEECVYSQAAWAKHDAEAKR